MTAQLIDGLALASQKLQSLKQKIETLRLTHPQPGLATLLVGDDPASRIYIRNKARACAEAGVCSIHHTLPANSTFEEVVEKIESLNQDPLVHGLLMQLPLPPHLDAKKLTQRIDRRKDVDGFNWQNLGALVEGASGLRPCTPTAIMAMLESQKIPIKGAHAVVLGRSTIVGKPVALMLVERGATVTICHSQTRALEAMTRQADILVVAIGKPRLVGAHMVKAGAAVIDVGINRLADGKICGDVDFEALKEQAGWLTPVPGGVGPMTVAMLVENTLQAYCALIEK
ncbi:MAG: bifunctional methylenetetrahydrofolate dehydrogenase/methenyltetrahydrofolate cyclohydrolase FolD [Betaproteobacteria bacterium]|jgi:methylenetetrahydrofolate dehydrogenase (NADP+)/methenyltetrahydrofolate cyclohydrolase